MKITEMSKQDFANVPRLDTYTDSRLDTRHAAVWIFESLGEKNVIS